MRKRSEINIRDPYVLVHEGKYYLYGTRGETTWGPATGFDVYVGEDLENWSDPIPCFENDGTFWADRNYWAPEVHVWQGKFYMFATFTKGEIIDGQGTRGTVILCADSPVGPFRPHSDGPVTPEGWLCLDGTFYVSRDGTPYMVFCHEWMQVGDGEICALPLTKDLRAAAGEPRLLFHASDAPWCVGNRMRHDGRTSYVTDGPFMWRTADGTLLMLWASFSSGGYTEGVAVSDNGDIDGVFTQAEPMFRKDGGHGMVFRGLDGHLYLTLHTPNSTLDERPVFIPVHEEDGRLAADAQLPAWYGPLNADLTAMAEELTASLTGWHGTDYVTTPEAHGYGGGLATTAIQAAIDDAAAHGGTALLTGEYVSGTLVLKSNVCLKVDKGAKLMASTDLNDFPEHHARRLTVQDTSMGMHQSLIFAEGCDNVCLCGEGVIDGRGQPCNFPGDETAQGTPGRPFVIRMIDCTNVHVHDVTLTDSPCWMENYLNCERLLVENITVRNHANYNNDGIDIDGCRDVIVRGCNIHSGDDACCFKGASQRPLDRVLVENCELYSACNAFKVGTDTQGDFRNVLVRNCRIGGLAEDPSGLKHPCSDSGISLEMVDGGTLERFLIKNVQITRAWSPIFMRLEDRGRVKPGDPVPPVGKLRRVAIAHVTGDANGPRGSYLIGIPEQAIEEVLLYDVHIIQRASGKPVLDEHAVSELRGVYPDAHMIDDLGDAPAYALWARHVKGLTCSDYQVITDGADPRPPFVLDTDVG